MKTAVILFCITTSMCSSKATVKAFENEYECQSKLERMKKDAGRFATVRGQCGSVDYLLQASKRED